MRRGGGDLPIFDEAPLEAIEFAPRALRPPGRDGRVVAGAWALAILSVIGIGLLTSEPEEGGESPTGVADAARSVQTDDPRLPARDLPSTRMGALLLQQVIELDSPAPRSDVTTRRVDVRGSVAVRADHVGIALEARGNRVLEQVWVNVFDPDGGIRPNRTPTFGASFDLPLPRPNGTMWVVVTAYDDRGMPLGSTRRAFSAGALVPTAAVVTADGAARDGPGPWGANAQPAAPAAPLPTCLPVSTTLASRC